MQFNFRSLFLCFLIYYFLIEGGIHEFITYGRINPISITDTAFSLSSLIYFFLYWLFCYTIFYKFYPTRRWLLIGWGIVLSFIIPAASRYLIEQKLFLYFFEITNYPETTKFKPYLFDQYLFGIRYIFSGIIYYFIRYSLYNQKREKELMIENQKMKLSLLLAQVNPHFLLNSLNNIQSLVYLKSDKAVPALEHLSDLLKYTLYQNEKWISIQKELGLIEKYIALERLRYDYEFEMHIEVDDDVQHLKIPQYLLLPILENSFKHANLKSKSNPFNLKIKKQTDGILVQSSNEIVKQSKDKVGGIGLENLRKRLALLFEKEISFKVEQKDQVFSIEIALPTND